MGQNPKHYINGHTSSLLPISFVTFFSHFLNENCSGLYQYKIVLDTNFGWRMEWFCPLLLNFFNWKGSKSFGCFKTKNNPLFGQQRATPLQSVFFVKRSFNFDGKHLCFSSLLCMCLLGGQRLPSFL